MSHEHLHRLMTEIGPFMHLREVVEYADEARWVLVLDNGAVIEAEHDADRARLALSIEIGEPAAEDAAALYRTLLQYNQLWRNTGGIRMALADQTVVQSVELPADASLDLDTLSRGLAGLHANTAVWRVMLASRPESDASRPNPLHPTRDMRA
jgi:hypothetical protein